MKILLHRIGIPDSEAQREKVEVPINQACQVVLLEEEAVVLDECDVTVTIATGKDEVSESFINILALPSMEAKGKLNFKMIIPSPYFWCTWVEGKGDNIPNHFQFGYSTARFKWGDGHSLEIEMDHRGTGW